MQKWPQTKGKRGRWLRRVAGCWLTCWLNETVRFGAKREGEGKKRKMAGEREREREGERGRVSEGRGEEREPLELTSMQEVS